MRYPSSVLGFRRRVVSGVFITALGMSQGCGNPVARQQSIEASPRSLVQDWFHSQFARLKKALGIEAQAFEVRGDADGFVLTWFDAQGAHLARRRSEVPEGARSFVRVEKRGHPTEDVVVGNLTQLNRRGVYPTWVVLKGDYEARVRAIVYGEAEGRKGDPNTPAKLNADVVIYGASWCETCHVAAAYFREKNINFVEKDIERMPEAKAEMLRKCRKAGISPDGIPVIDLRGHVFVGFDQEEIEHVIASGSVVL